MSMMIDELNIPDQTPVRFRVRKWIWTGSILLAIAFANSGLMAEEDPFRAAVKSIVGRQSDLLQDLTAEQYLRIQAEQKFDQERVYQLIEDLSSDRFAVRDAAHKRLLLEPLVPTTIPLKDIPMTRELKWRWARIHAKRESVDRQLLIAALESIEQRKPKGLLNDLLKLIKQTESVSFQHRLARTFGTVAQADDREQIEATLKHEFPLMRQAAADALLRLFKKQAISTLTPLLKDSDLKTRFHIARGLLDAGYRPALQALAKLLECDQPQLAQSAWRVISAATEHDMGNLPYSKGQMRDQQIRVCQEWVSANLETVELKLPLKKYLFLRNTLAGNTLLAIDGEFIIELDPQKKEIFRLKVPGINGVEKLPDGNFIVHSYSSRYLKLIDAKGKVIWKLDGVFNGTQLLPNGNLLVSRGGDKLAVEYDLKTRKVVWEFKTPQWVNDVDRLPDGNTVIANHGGILIVSPEKKVVWEYNRAKDSRSYLTAQPLDNGNILVASSTGVVYEVSRDKKVVWEMPKLPALQDAMKDANGNLFVMTSEKVMQYDSKKKLIWERGKTGAFGEVRR